MYVFRWSFKNHLNYKNSTSPSQIQYQINNSTPFIPIPDNLTVNMLMKPTYDDGMTEKLPVQFLMWYLRISNELLLLHPLLIGVWRSWLAHMSGGHGVGSSSLLTPTKQDIFHSLGGVLSFYPPPRTKLGSAPIC